MRSHSSSCSYSALVDHLRRRRRTTDRPDQHRGTRGLGVLARGRRGRTRGDRAAEARRAGTDRGDGARRRARADRDRDRRRGDHRDSGWHAVRGQRRAAGRSGAGVGHRERWSDRETRRRAGAAGLRRGGERGRVDRRRGCLPLQQRGRVMATARRGWLDDRPPRGARLGGLGRGEPAAAGSWWMR